MENKGCMTRADWNEELCGGCEFVGECPRVAEEQEVA